MSLRSWTIDSRSSRLRTDETTTRESLILRRLRRLRGMVPSGRSARSHSPDTPRVWDGGLDLDERGAGEKMRASG